MGTESENDGLPCSRRRSSVQGRTCRQQGEETGHVPWVPRSRGRPPTFDAHGPSHRSVGRPLRSLDQVPNPFPTSECMVEASAVERHPRTRPSTEVAGRAALAHTPATARAVVLMAASYPQARVMASLASPPTSEVLLGPSLLGPATSMHHNPGHAHQARARDHTCRSSSSG